MEIKLGKDQEHALEELSNFIDDSNMVGKSITLSGAAGTGKTFLVQYLLKGKIAERYGCNYLLCAPTHKARLVLNKYTDKETMTIHTLLGLKPFLDIMELDLKDLKFNSRSKGYDLEHGLIICDEASMINDNLYDKLLELCAIKNNKIIFIGDKAQLQPVKAHGVSKVFDSGKFVELNEIFRQSSKHGALDYLSELRVKPIMNFNTNIGEDGGLIKLEFKEYLRTMVLSYRKTVNENKSNIEDCKVLAWTNAKVTSYNSFIRKYLFPDSYDNMYNEGEIVTMYANTQQLFNSMDYVVENVTYKTCTIDGLKIKVTHMFLLDKINNKKNEVNVLAKDTDKDDLIEFITRLEQFRINAVALKSAHKYSKSKENWTKYYEYFNLFLSPVDFKIDGRTVKQKQIDYGYACTVHKSQGSTYDTVFVDLQDILNNRSQAELRQLEYVALSRARNNIYVY